jgi:hypothetical protein
MVTWVRVALMLDRTGWAACRPAMTTTRSGSAEMLSAENPLEMFKSLKVGKKFTFKKKKKLTL